MAASTGSTSRARAASRSSRSCSETTGGGSSLRRLSWCFRGFLAFVTRPERRAAVCEALRGLIQVTFEIDNEGSRIMIYEPNGIGAVHYSNQPAAPRSSTNLQADARWSSIAGWSDNPAGVHV